MGTTSTFSFNLMAAIAPPQALTAQLAAYGIIPRSQLGRGAFSTVWRSSCTAPVGGSAVPAEVAVKVYVSAASTSNLTTAQLIAVAQKEHGIYSKLQHPHITATHGLLADAGLVASVLELMSAGDLFSSITPNFGMPLDESRAVLAGVCSGLSYLHTAHGLAHLDLKSENIFLSPGPVAKLGDFDAAQPAGSRTVRVRGTESIHPPEFLIPNQEFYTVTTSADVWAVGMLAYTVLFGSYAWISTAPGRDPRYAAFLESKTILPTAAPEPLKALFGSMLAPDSSSRPTAAQIQTFVESSWVPLCGILRSASGPQTPQGQIKKPTSSPAVKGTQRKKRSGLMRAWKALSTALK